MYIISIYVCICTNKNYSFESEPFRLAARLSRLGDGCLVQVHVSAEGNLFTNYQSV